MKKILLILICILLSNLAGFAATPDTQNFVEHHTSEIMTEIQNQRSKIYSSLDLSQEQFQLINNIDKNRYEDITPELNKLSLLVKKLDDLANSEDCTIKKVKKVQKEFKPIQKELYTINLKYEKELKNTLTKEQLTEYDTARKLMRKNLRNNKKS